MGKFSCAQWLRYRLCSPAWQTALFQNSSCGSPRLFSRPGCLRSSLSITPSLQFLGSSTFLSPFSETMLPSMQFGGNPTVHSPGMVTPASRKATRRSRARRPAAFSHDPGLKDHHDTLVRAEWARLSHQHFESMEARIAEFKRCKQVVYHQLCRLVPGTVATINATRHLHSLASRLVHIHGALSLLAARPYVLTWVLRAKLERSEMQRIRDYCCVDCEEFSGVRCCDALGGSDCTHLICANNCNQFEITPIDDPMGQEPGFMCIKRSCDGCKRPLYISCCTNDKCDGHFLARSWLSPRCPDCSSRTIILQGSQLCNWLYAAGGRIDATFAAEDRCEAIGRLSAVMLQFQLRYWWKSLTAKWSFFVNNRRMLALRSKPVQNVPVPAPVASSPNHDPNVTMAIQRILNMMPRLQQQPKEKQAAALEFSQLAAKFSGSWKVHRPGTAGVAGRSEPRFLPYLEDFGCEDGSFIPASLISNVECNLAEGVVYFLYKQSEGPALWYPCWTREGSSILVPSSLGLVRSSVRSGGSSSYSTPCVESKDYCTVHRSSRPCPVCDACTVCHKVVCDCTLAHCCKRRHWECQCTNPAADHYGGGTPTPSVGTLSPRSTGGQVDSSDMSWLMRKF